MHGGVFLALVKVGRTLHRPVTNLVLDKGYLSELEVGFALKKHAVVLDSSNTDAGRRCS